MNNLVPQLRSLSTGVVALLFAMGVVTLGVMSWTDVRAEVELTVHNLGTAGPAGSNTFGVAGTSGTAEVCVFCHTPHGGSTAAAVPLWNRTLNAPGNYTTYATLNSATIEGAIAPVGSVSIACLSCHDGTQAMDTVLNEPGSGLTNAIYAAGSWTGPNVNAGTGFIENAPLLGEDISNDHPIGIQYGGGGLTAAAPTGTLGDSDMNPASFTPLNGVNVFWVDTVGGTAGRDKTDMILYNRDVAGIAGGLQPYVECASCHDPHSDVNPTFLRTSNDNSAVCLTCHSK
jgi:predicted CXXCH cytochrome family protein